MDIDYQWIADELRNLTGATFVLVNIYDKESMKTITRGFSGFSGKTRKVVKILGYDVAGKAWNIKEDDYRVMRSNKLVRIGHLHEFSFNRIPPLIVSMLEKVIKLGDSFGIGITYNEDILGSFIIMMREGEHIESPDIVELFVNQLGMMLLRKKAEQDIRKIDQQYKTVFNGSQNAMFLLNVNSENSFAYHMINKGYELDVGISAKAVYGMTPRELYGDMIGRQIEEHYIDCITEKKPLVMKKNSLFWVRKRFGIHCCHL